MAMPCLQPHEHRRLRAARPRPSQVRDSPGSTRIELPAERVAAGAAEGAGVLDGAGGILQPRLVARVVPDVPALAPVSVRLGIRAAAGVDVYGLARVQL